MELSRDVWTNVQKAESLLVGAAVTLNPTTLRDYFGQFEVDIDLLGLADRMVCGFDPDHFSSQDYLVRYPFSSLPAIDHHVAQLVDVGFAVYNDDNTVRFTEKAREYILGWMQTVGQMARTVDLGDIESEAIARFLDYDRRIIEQMSQTPRPHGNPILGCRLNGLHTAYDQPELWHHWQYAWTMLAASEDEEEYVRGLRGLSPLVWFIRRQLWFVERRPWRSRGTTLERLVGRAVSYSPVEDAESACRAALDDLLARGWVEAHDNGTHRLTEAGLAACDADEQEVDEHLLSTWPDFSADEVADLNDIAVRLNARFMEIIRPMP